MAVIAAVSGLLAPLCPPSPCLAFDDVVDDVAPFTLYLGTPPDTLQIRYYSNRPLLESHDDITRAVVVIHGTLRNSNDYFDTIMQAADETALGDSLTLIVAPQFLVEADLEEHGLPQSMLFWGYFGWRQGDQSLSTPGNTRPWDISSFAVADTIIQGIAARNPNLEKIVITGHSAGGQFVNRFAAGSPTHAVVENLGIELRYIVANPSSYIYMNAERWVAGSPYVIELPDTGTVAACQEYNDYKYGLENPNPYMDIGDELIRERYSTRPVVLLMGEFDDNPDSYYLDQSCPAMMEGVQRLQRGIIYAEHLIDFFGPGIFDLHDLAVVSTVAHSHSGMFRSDCGVYYMFDEGDCEPVLLTYEWLDVTTEETILSTATSVSWTDYDKDGLYDLHAMGFLDTNVLLHNEGDGTFSVDSLPGLGGLGSGVGGLWGDYDNDRDQDLFLMIRGTGCGLLRNDGLDGFTNVTQGPLNVKGVVRDGEWGDYDNDGDLDLFVCRGVGEPNVLLRNEGMEQFTDVTSGAAADTGDAWSTSWGDFDGDGDLDLYLAINGPNKLLRNDGEDLFTDVTSGCLGDTGTSTSGVWGDFDNDGDLDLCVSNRLTPNRVLRNDGDGVFEEFPFDTGSDNWQTWSAGWVDYDNDGYLDVYFGIAGSRNRLFRNLGDGTFDNVTPFPIGDRGSCFGGTWCDSDNDGDLDLLLANSSSNRHYLNQGAGGNHWLHIDLEGETSNSAGIGARIDVVAGGLSQMRVVGVGNAGYVVQNPHTATFGLGTHALVDTLRISWPSGTVQEFLAFLADRRVTISETEDPSAVGDDKEPVSLPSLFASAPNPFGRSTRIAFRVTRRSEVSLTLYDVSGRRVRRLIDAASVDVGTHGVVWDGRDDVGRLLGAGVYYYRLKAGDRSLTRRTLLVR